MKSKNYIEYIKEEICFSDNDCKEVNFEVTLCYCNQGIGSYEYWGQKCNDVQMGFEPADITWDEKLYSDEENKIIDIYLGENDIYYKAISNLQNDRPDSR
jgi:hypothetical protein